MHIQSLFFLVVLVTPALACQGLTPPTLVPATTITSPTAASTSNANPKLVHFENEWVAFDYPGEFKLHQAGDAAFHWYPDLDLGGELVAGLGDPTEFAYEQYFRSLRIMRRAMPAGSDLQKIMADTYDPGRQRLPLQEGMLKATGPVTVSGLPAYQKTYRVYSGEPAYDLRDIWVQHDGTLYTIAIATGWHNPDSFAAFQALADRWLQSLKIK